MYPKRLILDDARQLGLAVLGLDVNASEKAYVVERVGPDADGALRDGIRLALAEVKGINDGEVERIVAARPFHSLTDFWHRARVSRPIVERLVLAGGVRRGLRHRRLGADGRAPPRPGHPARPAAPGRRARPARPRGRAGRAGAGGSPAVARAPAGSRPGSVARAKADDAAARNSSDPRVRDTVADLERHPLGEAGVWARAAAQSRATAPPPPVDSVQLTLDARRRAGRGRGLRAAGDDRRGADEGRARDPRPRRQPARRRLLRAVPRRARRDPQPRPAHPAQQVRAAGRRGQGRHPDPADPLRAPGHLPDPRRRHRPGRRDVLRGRPGPLRRHGLPLLAAGGARRAAPDRLPRRLAARHRLLGAAGAGRALAARGDRGGARAAGRRPGGVRRRWASRRRARCRRVALHPAGDGHAADVRRPEPTRPTTRPAAWAGAGCWCTPAASRCRRTPTSSRPARTPRTSPASSGTAVPGARDERPPTA